MQLDAPTLKAAVDYADMLADKITQKEGVRAYIDFSFRKDGVYIIAMCGRVDMKWVIGWDDLELIQFNISCAICQR